jgi:hypothetical protein
MDLPLAAIPQRLIRQLFELDADYGEASGHCHAMLRDTLVALNQLPEACARFRTNLPRYAQSILAQLEITVRRGLDPAEAYLDGARSRPPKRLSTPGFGCLTVLGAVAESSSRGADL